MSTRDTGVYKTSVPDLVAQIRIILLHFLTHAALPLPWPHFVPTPERLNSDIARLEKAFAALSDNTVKTPVSLNRARRELKTSLAKVVRYVEMVVNGSNDLRKWPGFDLSRHPGERHLPPRALQITAMLDSDET